MFPPRTIIRWPLSHPPPRLTLFSVERYFISLWHWYSSSTLPHSWRGRTWFKWLPCWGMWRSSLWHVYYPENFMCRILLANLVQILYQGNPAVPPLSSFYKENVCTPRPASLGYLHQPFFQMGYLLRHMKSHLLCWTKPHYCGCGLFHKMGWSASQFPSWWRNCDAIPI